MNKKHAVALILGVLVLVVGGLYLHGFIKGKEMGKYGKSELAAGIVLLTMNPVSQEGFKAGFKQGLEEKKELEEWSKDYFGPWSGFSSKDKITDYNNYYLINEGDNGPYGNKASLNLRCNNDKTEVYIKWGGYLIGKNNSLKVTHRIDDKKPETSNWIISTNNESFFYGNNNIQFIKSMIGGNNMIIKFDDNGVKTVTFELLQLEEKIKPLAEACHWRD